MTFQKIPIEGKDTHYRIIPKTGTGFATERQPTPNPNDVKILRTDYCPIEETCIWIDENNMTCGCNHLAYPIDVGVDIQLDSLLCKYAQESMLKISHLKTTDCRANELPCVANGIQCNHLNSVTVFPYGSSWELSAPHAFVTCSQF
jgi:hypothetical protein